jgi:hypothetical protein
MPYNVCPNCGQKALTVATRCPRCGVAFETQFLGRQAPAKRPSRVPMALVIIGGVALIVVANVVIERSGIVPPRSAALEPAPRPVVAPQPSRESLLPAAESLRRTRPAAPQPESQPQSPAPSPTRAAESLAPPVPLAAVAPAGASTTERRYASDWTNLRASRSSSAAVIRILRPGEAVLVDSLGQGWYRVVSDGQPVGYADRRLLGTTPPLP